MIFIPGNVPSLKNSKVMTKRGIFSSPTVSKYIRTLGIQHFNSRRQEVKGYVDIYRPNIFETFRAEWIKMMVGKKLDTGIEQIANNLAQIPYGAIPEN